MKKILMITLAAAFLCSVFPGCITINVNPETKEESESTQETDLETETGSEEETENAVSLVGTYRAKDTSDSYLVIRSDGTVLFADFSVPSSLSYLWGGVGGSAKTDGNGVLIELPLSETDLLELTGASDGTLLTLKAEREEFWSEKTFEKTDLTEVFVVGAIQADGMKKLFPDGSYVTSSFVDFDKAYSEYLDKEPILKSASVIDGMFVLTGSLGSYDADYNLTLYPYATYEFPLADDFKVYSSGGEAEDQEADPSYIEQVFQKDVIGLGLTIVLENGYVINAYAVS